MKKKREKSQMINTRNGRGGITNSKYAIDSKYVKRIIME